MDSSVAQRSTSYQYFNYEGAISRTHLQDAGFKGS